jgi:hypothetical protein
MSVSKISLFIKVPLSSAEIKNRVQDIKSSRYEQVQLVKNFLKGLEGSQEAGIVNLEIGDGSGDAVSATGLVSIAGSGAQSVTINGASLTGGTDYVIANLSASDIAANLLQAITDSQSSRVQSVYGELSGSTVVLKAKSAGTVGNLVTTTATGDASVGGSTLDSGVEGTQNVLKFNLNS